MLAPLWEKLTAELKFNYKLQIGVEEKLRIGDWIVNYSAILISQSIFLYIRVSGEMLSQRHLENKHTYV